MVSQLPEFVEWTRFSVIYTIIHCYLMPFTPCIHRSLGVIDTYGKLEYVVFVVFLLCELWIFFASVTWFFYPLHSLKHVRICSSTALCAEGFSKTRSCDHGDCKIFVLFRFLNERMYEIVQNRVNSRQSGNWLTVPYWLEYRYEYVKLLWQVDRNFNKKCDYY